MSMSRKVAVIIVFLAGMILIGVAAVLCISGYINALGQQDAVERGVIVEASLVGVNSRGGKNNSLKDINYEYYDENGIRYYGEVVLGLDGYDDAHKYIEEVVTVSIYIDGKGHSIVVGEKPATTLFITLSIVFCIIFAFGLITAGVFFYKDVKAKAKKKKCG